MYDYINVTALGCIYESFSEVTNMKTCANVLIGWNADAKYFSSVYRAYGHHKHKHDFSVI